MGRPIFFVVNSAFGKPGNVGMRIARLVNARANSSDLVFCRSRHSSSQAKIIHFGFLGDLLRGFNAVRIYITPSFRSRLYDAYGFELLFFLWFLLGGKRLLVQHVVSGNNQALVSEGSPKIIRALKKIGFIVTLDIPIAPVLYNKRMSEVYECWPLPYLDFMAAREKDSFMLADRLLCPSQFVSRELRLILSDIDKLIYIEPFGVDLQIPLRGKFDSGGQQLKFCFLGSVGKRKGIPFLLTAWEEVAHPSWRLLLCGRPDRDIIRRVKSSPFLERSVVLKGFVESFDVLLSSDIFVFPSLMEGSSKAVYEAMACGLPCIVTYESGSVIENNLDGIVVDAADVGQLSAAMKRLSENRDLRLNLGVAAREKATKYSWHNYAERISARLES